MSTTNWPRTDSEIKLTGAYTCTHHNDQQRAACPGCLVTTLTAERDQLRAEVERLNGCCEELHTIIDNHGYPSGTDYAKMEARAERAEADLAALGQSFDDNCRGVVRIAAELAAERARLDYLLQWDVTFHDRADIDAELSYGQRKKSTPTLP